VVVDAQAEQIIRSAQIYRRQLGKGVDPLVVEGDRVTTARLADSSCAFLDPDNLCQLHKELGGHSKPLVCQTYPYLLTETPDGIFATISYACPAALECTGPTLEESRSALEDVIFSRWSETPQGQPVGERVRITQEHWLSWSDYLVLEKEILRAFSAARPVETLLAAAVLLLLAEPANGEPSPRTWTLDAPYSFGGFDRELATMVTSNLLAITEGVTDPEERARLGSFFWNGGIHQSTRFGLQLPTFTLRQPHSEQAQEQIGRYVRNAIFGKRLLSGTVVSRLLSMVCGISILLFYVEAFRTCSPDNEALDRAFTLVESELLSHTRSFDGFFIEFEAALCSVRDSLRAS
jgi:Fe-S-cluster containining protein